MPERKTVSRAQADKRAGKAPSTQAGEFVREEIEHVRAGKHGVRSAKQAVAIGLSKARRAGVDVKPPKEGATSEGTRKKAEKGQHKTAAKPPSKETKAKRSRTTTAVLKRESRQGASSAAMSKQAKSAAAKRPAASRSAAAKKAAETKGATGRSTAAKKAAHTRAARTHH